MSIDVARQQPAALQIENGGAGGKAGSGPADTLDAAVANVNDAVGMSGNIAFVGYQQNGVPSLVEAGK